MIPTVLAQSYPLISPQRGRNAPEGKPCPCGRASLVDGLAHPWLRLLRGDQKPNRWHPSSKMAVKEPEDFDALAVRSSSRTRRSGGRAAALLRSPR